MFRKIGSSLCIVVMVALYAWGQTPSKESIVVEESASNSHVVVQQLPSSGTIWTDPKWWASVPTPAIMGMLLAWIIIKGNPDRDKTYKEIEDNRNKAQVEAAEKVAAAMKEMVQQHNELVDKICERHHAVEQEGRKESLESQREFTQAINNIRIHCQRVWDLKQESSAQ